MSCTKSLLLVAMVFAYENDLTKLGLDISDIPRVGFDRIGQSWLVGWFMLPNQNVLNAATK